MVDGAGNVATFEQSAEPDVKYRGAVPVFGAGELPGKAGSIHHLR